MTEAEVTTPPSTVLEQDTPLSPSGGGVPRTLGDDVATPDPKPAEKPEAKLSLRDTIAAQVKKEATKTDESDADPDAKEKDEAQPAKADDGQAKAEKAETPKADRAEDGRFAPKAKPEDGEIKPAEKLAGHIEAPRNFLPDAKETWRNTPRAVQRDVQNAIKQHEEEVAKHREASERYESVRQFDEVARSNGRAGIHETLQEVAQLEEMMAKNPVAALNQALMRAGPRKPDGQPYSLFEVAQAIVQKGPQGYQQMVAQTQQRQTEAQPNAEVEQLKRQLAQVQEQQLEATVIAPFRQSHPRYTELEADIAFFLQSGRIPQSLSPTDRLEAAYDMAARINPASHAEPSPPQADPDLTRRAEPDFSGTKSIKSAPGAVSAEMEPDRGGSIRDVLQRQLKVARRS